MEENSNIKTAQEYDRYMPKLMSRLNDIAISIMSIVEECDCENYEHTSDKYIIHISKNENS
tara:strand:+ start:2575 stop:2757 length:183 start_codon:yes stop_codon:yes gene_type:complete